MKRRVREIELEFELVSKRLARRIPIRPIHKLVFSNSNLLEFLRWTCWTSWEKCSNSYTIADSRTPMVDFPNPIRKASLPQKRSHQNSVQNGLIERSTVLTGTIFVTISMFMFRGNFQAAFGYNVSGEEVSNRFTGSQFQTNSQNWLKQVWIPKNSNSNSSNQFVNLFHYGAHWIRPPIAPSNSQRLIPRLRIWR